LRNAVKFTAVATTTALAWAMSTQLASAQEQPATETAQPPEADEPEARRDVVVVTARRREESIIDVPATATFMGAEDLEARGIASSKDLVRAVPGLTVSSTGSEANSNIVVRGQGASTAFRGNAEGAVGLYEDGAFIGSSSLTRMAFVDLARAEVLRGPQSAYFSRDALGGAVNLVHVEPELGVTSGGVTLGYGSNVTYAADGYINVPLGDRFAVRLTGVHFDKQRGFFKSSPDARTGRMIERFADREDYDGIRAQALWEPSDTFSALLKIESFSEDAPGLGLYSYDLVAQDYYSPHIDTPDRFTRDTQAQALTLTWGIGDGTLTSRTVGRQIDSIFQFDRDELFGFPFNGGGAVAASRELWEGYRDTTVESFQQIIDYVQPVQVFGMSGDVALGGEYLSTDTLRFGYESTICASTSPPPPGLGCATGAGADPANANNVTLFEQSFESYSAFASLRLDVTDRLDVTIDGRMIWDSSDFYGQLERGTNAQRVYDRFINPQVRTDSAEWDNFAPAVSFVYSLTDDTNIFGRIATGYRPGGFNERTAADLSIPAGTALLPGSFEPETNISYELGVKGEYSDVLFFDSVFADVATYYIESSDVVIDNTASVVNPTDSIINNTNAGETEQYGVEFQLRTVSTIGETRLTSSVSLNYAEGFYTTPGALANPQIDASTGTISNPGNPIFGNSIPLLPKWQASASVGFEHSFDDDVTAFGSLGFTGEWDQAHDQSQAQAFTKRISDRQLFDLDLGVSFGSYTIRGQVKNLFDNQFSLAPAVAAQQRTVRTNIPMEYRIEVSYAF
jgi:iron complex outermembrane receptor protein